MAYFPGSKCLVGVHIEDTDRIENSLSHGFSSVRVFKTSMDSAGLLTPDVVTMSGNGKLPIISFRSTWQGKALQWVDLAKNRYGTDKWIIDQRNKFQKNHDINAIVIYSPEMDGEANSYSPWPQKDPRTSDSYRAAVDHIMNIFAKNGGTPNVRFACVTTGSNIAYNDNPTYDGLWARKFFNTNADYLGSDPYNWCPGSGHGDGLRTFEEITQPIHDVQQAFNKPVILAEMASWYKSDDSSFREDFLNAIPAVLSNWKRLKAFSYFSKWTDCDWRLETQAASMAAMDNILASAPVYSL